MSLGNESAVSIMDTSKVALLVLPSALQHYKRKLR